MGARAHRLRRQFRYAMREKLRERGQSLQRERQQQQQRIVSTLDGLNHKARVQGDGMREARERGRQKVDEANRRTVEHGQQLIREEHAWLIRKRAAIEARRRQKEAETVSLSLIHI